MMDAIEMLKDFAKSQGINIKEVDKFLAQFDKPKTIREVMALPHDMQLHEKYITWLAEPLHSFIMDEWYDGERYETLKVDRIVDFLYDKMYDLIDDDDTDIDEVDISSLVAKDESKQERLDELKAIAQCIIDIKFGSVKIDW